jgi:threonine 3-dehydrogenase
MKALMKTRPARGAELREAPTPELGPHDALVHVRAASICGTDLHIYHWHPSMQARIKPPLIFGHEFCGVVERVGSEVSAVRPGDFVSAEMHVTCGRCLQCRIGQAHICQNLKIIGLDLDGCFAQYVKIPETNIWKLDPAIPIDYGAVLDPLGNAVHAVLAGEIAGLSVAVIGCGPIGLFALEVARACGAAARYAVEVKEHRLQLARRLGATAVFNPQKDDVVAAILEATGGVGVDVALEMSGAAEAIRMSLKILRAGGRISLLGLPDRPVELDLVGDLIFKGATVQGIFGRRMYDTWYKMIALLKAGVLNLDPLISERLPLEKFERAFELLDAGQASKILLYPNGLPDSGLPAG